jgi:hypothetical protein
MRVIHFTEGAADRLQGFGSKGVRFLPLADGSGESHIGCVHLAPGATIEAPSLTHAAALLVVHGRVSIKNEDPFIKIQVHAGMGCVFERHEPYSLQCATGAVLLIVESHELKAHRRGISTPGRIAGQRWPSDSVTA